jgi:hypothetical protein
MIRSEATAKAARPIPSSTAEQAAIIVETLFAYASASVHILTGNLNARIYGANGVMVEAKKFLALKNTTLSIVFLEPQHPSVWQSHPLLDWLKYNSNVEAFVCPAEISEQIAFHFVAADCNSYRFKAMGTSHTSVTAFGDYAFAKKLVKIYHRLKSISRPLERTVRPDAA